MSENTKTFDEFIDEKVTADADFQATLTDLGEDEKATAIETRRKELIVSEAPIFFEENNKNKKAYDDTKVRAEKAEGEVKKLKPPVEKKDDAALSTKDVIALSKANIPDEDIDDVLEAAKFKGISVADALASPFVKAILEDKAEVRRTSNATNTRSTRQQTTTIDGNEIIANVKNGKGEDALPEPGSKAAEALFDARHKKQS